MEINKDIFECAANTLNITELKSILELNELKVDKKRKYEIIDMLLDLIDKEKMKEEVYKEVYLKAYSTGGDCNEGFYYKYTNKNIEFKYSEFEKAIKEKIEKEEKSRHGASVFKYDILCPCNNEIEEIVTFIFRREKKNKKYDSVDNEVKTFNEVLEVNVEIDYKNRLVYLQSKNYNNSQAVKYFLEKILNELRIDKNDVKINLGLPKFDGQIVQKWANEEKIEIKGIPAITIHMLDLLSDFKDENNGFVNYSMRKIYFGENTSESDEEHVDEAIYRGSNIEKTIEIADGILKGKRINGFELDANYMYGDIEEGEEPQIIKVPISILQEENKTVRISILKDMIAIEKNVQKEIYQSVKDVFIKKLNAERIENTDSIKAILSQNKKVLELMEEEKLGNEKKENRMIRI